MPKEYRILEIHRGHILAQSLDRVTPESLKISRPSNDIENEVLIVERDSAAGNSETTNMEFVRCTVIATRIDPSFIGDTVPQLVLDNDEEEYEFDEYISYEEGEDFEVALETFRSRFYDKARGLLRDFIRRFPLPHRHVSPPRYH